MSRRILFVSSEVYPFAKTGGLADVSHSLPRALNAIYNVEVVMPLYRSIDKEKYNISPWGKPFDLLMGGVSYPLQFHSCTFEGIKYLFIYTPCLCDREFLYGTHEAGYEDNAIRFGLFSWAIMLLLKGEHYDIVHLNDWQSALVALLVNEESLISTKTIFTIHNLAYQGVFEHSVLKFIGIDERYFTMDALEFYNKVNFIKAGIAYAQSVTTVSPTYAKEILSHKYGCGLEGFLELHSYKLRGILNGIDAEHFSPVSDTALVATYNSVKGKRVSKSAFLKHIKLKGVTKPLFVFIGRFAEQKGMDLLIESLDKIAHMDCNIALLGEGANHFHEELTLLSQRHKNIHLTIKYDEAFAHQMYAASDFLLMPSLFEPCGLNQMIAFAYGSIPIVHHVGGLADTVKRFDGYDAASSYGYGVLFNTPKSRSFVGAVQKALDLYSDKKLFEEIANHNMKCDFSWTKSAKIYSDLYEKLLK
ncbi:glycogen synthase [Sulfurimonas sp.]|uniref:glycogen synthase n=1 Tax=Sulfurimonas sp. TaxID=2022749 RepID=UPI0025D6D572|nr:glycogen synthase [Sulfurimonas sp.]MDD5157027.1 glycogen synthase [Sulfurimonas sp.]